jgi:hypothetical protein
MGEKDERRDMGGEEENHGLSSVAYASNKEEIGVMRKSLEFERDVVKWEKKIRWGRRKEGE